MKYLILALLLGCGALTTETETVDKRCDPIYVEVPTTERIEIPGDLQETEVEVPAETIYKTEIIEVEKIVFIQTDTPLYFTGIFCRKSVLQHDDKYYVVHKQLIELKEGNRIKIGKKCKIKLHNGLIKEIK